MTKLPSDHAILVKLGELLEIVTDQQEWYYCPPHPEKYMLIKIRYGVAEEAVGATYALAKHPDVLCSETIRRRTKQIFSPAEPLAKLADEAGDIPMEDAAQDPIIPCTPKPLSAPIKTTSKASDLSQLLFIVGHVASMFPYLILVLYKSNTLTNSSCPSQTNCSS